MGGGGGFSFFAKLPFSTTILDGASHECSHYKSFYFHKVYFIQPPNGNSLPGLWLECRVNQQDRSSRAGRGKICCSRSLGVLGAHRGIKPEALQSEDLCNCLAKQKSILRAHIREG